MNEMIVEEKIDYKSMNLYQKLNEVSKTATYVKKTEEGFKFKYAGSADLLGKIRPKMQEVGVLLKFHMDSFELIQKPNGTSFPLVRLSYTWINVDNPIETDRTEITLFEDKMTGCQSVGALLTYAERYFLYKFFQVPTDEDAPEQFYKKQEMSAKVEDQKNLKKEPKKEVKKEPNERRVVIEGKYYLLAEDLWGLMRKKQPEFPAVYPEEMPEYLRHCQKVMPNSHIKDHLENWAELNERFFKGMADWSNAQNSLMDERDVG